MPTAANLVVKNVANADVTYNLASASGGDNQPAVWRANAASNYVAYRPTFTVLTRDNARKNGRVFRASYKWPVTIDDANSNPVLIATIPLEVNGTLPTNIDVTLITEAFTQFGNLIASTLIRSSATEGYAPA